MAVQDTEFLHHVLDLLQVAGPVSARSMFGGHGLFMDGLMFAIVIDDVLYLKVDDQIAYLFEDEGLPPFVYTRQGKEVSLSYCQAPDVVLEDVDEMRRWADLAWAAAVRAHGK